MHSQDPTVLTHLGANLRRFRQAAGLSQQALAEASSISRRMIAALEGEGANISLSSLDKLANALGVGFVDLVAEPAVDPKRIGLLAWRGHSPDSRGVLLGSVPARHETQLWSWSLAPGETYQAEADPIGWHEMIAVTEGRLRVELETAPLTVEAGDFTIFNSAQSYRLVNAGEGVLRFFRTVVG
ncbi:helix-turn-helix domain-containing protein [Paracoccus aminophilus]|nr:XRE family transcriptional regulator [Paracoccus aminophilus]